MHYLKNIKVAEFSFKTMSYFGIWRPTTLTSFWAIRLYNFYTINMMLFYFYYAITFLINLFQNKHKPDIFIENIFFFSSALLIALKITYVVLARQDVNSLLNLFSHKYCLPRNNEENMIYKNFQEKER